MFRFRSVRLNLTKRHKPVIYAPDIRQSIASAGLVSNTYCHQLSPIFARCS